MPFSYTHEQLIKAFLPMVFKASSPEGDTKRLWDAGKLLFLDIGDGAVNMQQAEYVVFCQHILVQYKVKKKKKGIYARLEQMGKGKGMRKLSQSVLGEWALETDPGLISNLAKLGCSQKHGHE